MKRFQRLAAVASGLTLAQVAVGALVRATRSGLGCGNDWPRCHGRLLPAMADRAVAIEFSHRLVASIVIFAVSALAIYAWLKYRNVRSIFWPSFAAMVLVFGQGAIGGLVVLADLARLSVVLHFIVASTLLGVLTYVTVRSGSMRQGGWHPPAKRALFAMCGVFVALLIGAFVSQTPGAPLVFPDWPLMNGTIGSPAGTVARLHWVHRLVAVLLGVALIDLAVRATRRSPRDRHEIRYAHGLVGLWAIQVGLGALNVFTRSASWAIVLHVIAASLLWMLSVALVVHLYRRDGAKESSTESVASDEPGLGDRVKAYFLLTKPRIIELLLITTVPPMVVAAEGWPRTSLVLATLFGGMLTAGAANSINCYYDRDIDERMERTASRPLPAHRVTPRSALRFGVALGVIGGVWMYTLVGPLPAALAVGAILFYVFVYTAWMKRSTPSNIVIGGAAGAVPVLIGWAAVTGHVSAPSWVMFAIIFYWTPPHFWALALRYSDEYAAAGVPMLPVVRGVAETTRQMIMYSAVLMAASLALYPIGAMGIPYLVSALVLGAGFIVHAIRLSRSPSPLAAMGFFRSSISYLVLIFAAMTVDTFIGRPRLPALDGPVLFVSVILFLIFEGLILGAVVGYRRSSPSLRSRTVITEIVWTVTPVILLAVGLLIAWQTGTLAAP
ncbi:MAG TPA: heme o synthase [Actinomycetota bacterium]|nr:heme o synthase [Actinomycetota bacterium]